MILSSTSVRVNSAAVLALSRRVVEMENTVRELLGEGTFQLQPSVDHALRVFQSTLIKMKSELDALGKRSYLSQLVHQKSDHARFLVLSKEIDKDFGVLMFQLNLSTAAMVSAQQSGMNTCEDRFRALLDTVPEATSTCLAMRIPPKPQRHFGRDGEVQAVVQTIASSSASRVAILGGPGMGKTTLAVTVLQHSSVVARFGAQRFFIPCDASEGQSSCLSIISGALGIATSTHSQLPYRDLQAVLGKAPTILVLDNFESAWEAADQRLEAEALLQFLGTMDNLSLMLTMRGSERPRGVSWSRPFLPPLGPLSETAGRQTFFSITDPRDADSESAAEVLLNHLDNIPLAIVLMASLAQTEPMESLLSQWRMLETSLLERGAGQSRLSSLPISLGLSMRSPRMQELPAAQHLLSMLSLLPNGAVDCDLRLWNVDRHDEALATLVQTALVSRTGAHRFYVLAPIRSYVLQHYPPDEVAVSRIYEHYFTMAELARTAAISGFDGEILSAVSEELANIDYIIRRAIKSTSSDIAEAAIKAILRLCTVHIQTGIGNGPGLLPAGLACARAWGFSTLEADLLLETAYHAFNGRIPGNPASLAVEARGICQRIEDSFFTIDCRIILARYLAPGDAVAEMQDVLRLAQQRWPHIAPKCTRELALALARDGQSSEAIVRYKEGIIALQHAADTVQDRPPKDMIGYSQLHIAKLEFERGDVVRGIEACNTARQSFSDAQNARGANLALGLLATIFIRQGRPLQAVEYALLAVEYPVDAVGVALYVQALTILAEAHARSGYVNAATTVIDRIKPLIPVGGFPPAAGCMVLRASGLVAMHLGNQDEARTLLSAACTTARERDPTEPPETMREAEAECMDVLSEADAAGGDVEAAAMHCLGAAILYRKTRNAVGSARCLVRLADLVDDSLAELLLAAVCPPLQRMEDSYGRAIALSRTADIALRRGEQDRARHCARKALGLFGEVKDERRIRMVHQIIDSEEG